MANLTDDRIMNPTALLRKADFMKAKSLAEVVIPDQPAYYEAYVYKITNLENDMKYVGYHKLKGDDRIYLTSASNEELKELLNNSKDTLKYEILEYGELSYIQNREHEILSKVNAAASPDWYNKTNGIPPSPKMPDADKIDELYNKIISESYPIESESVSELAKLPSWQVRAEKYDNSSLKYIKSQIETSRSTDDCNPIVILDNRLDSKICDIVDLRIDGAHTLKACYDLDMPEVVTMRIPESDHKDLSNEEVKMLTERLNKQEKVRKTPNSKDTLVNRIYERYLSIGIRYDHPINVNHLDTLNLSLSERNTVLKNAHDKIRQHKLYQSNNMVLIDYKNDKKDVLEKEVDELSKGKQFAYSFSSGAPKSAAGRVLFEVDDYYKENGEGTIDKINLIVYHTSLGTRDDWRERYADKFEDSISRHFDVPVEIKEMQTLEKKFNF